MTTEEKRKYINEECHKYSTCSDGCPLQDKDGKCLALDLERMDDAEVNEVYNLAFPTEAVVIDEVLPLPTIKDSGERREFTTGAVRDIQEGKGRCDLMPLDVVGNILNNPTFCYVYEFTLRGELNLLQDALTSSGVYHDAYTMCLEVAKHFEDGAKKYGEHNWQKGIPVHCYIDSAIRHYLKWLRGDTDEPHDRAFVWNILCCIWTCKHKPELNEYRKEN